MQSRDLWVDYAKAIGIILVVYGHVARGLQKAGIGMPESTFLLLDSLVYSFHMPLFFFLSGLFFQASFARRGAGPLVWSKVDTLVYPYLLWSLIQGSVEVSLSAYTNGNLGFGAVFQLWWPRAQFWFLYALFAIFLVATLIQAMAGRMALSLMLILSLVLYSIALVIPVNFLLGSLFTHMVFFVGGMSFSLYANQDWFAKGKTCALLLGLFVLGQAGFHLLLDLHYSNKGGAALLLAMLSIATVVSISMQLARTSRKWLLLLGTGSMAIYLMHILAGSGVRVLLQKVLGIESLPVHLLMGCLAGLWLPVLVLKLADWLGIPYLLSAPVSRWLRRPQQKLRQAD
ncbi:acyltransferase family protein [Bowmanella dokdonensis]|uniref:Acyltransferase family protein n=1 Tax=Bowmanella dokdonensis TaxID=751969 RepID=A0A939DLE2_9ALTE|nr:acyltransferase family protein [Bowmanella dokdonensis]MBN7824705.1 acyltransferase family protein [Bowmanella dokdonensis]